MHTYNKIMEKVWLLVGIGALVYGVYMHATTGYGPMVTGFYIATVIAIFYFFARRFMRRRMEKLHEEKGEEMMARAKEKAERKAQRKAEKKAKKNPQD